MPQRPFVLVGQQYLADPSRSNGDVHPLWAYAHVPHGYTGDATEALLDQIERFAPGLRERILARHVRSPSDLASYNPNYVGGDIITGANTAKQILFRPRIALDPYATGIPGVFICSAATPPGGAAPKRWNWPCASARNTTTQLAMPQATAAAALPMAADPPPPPPPQFMLEKRSAGRPSAAASREGSLRSLE